MIDCSQETKLFIASETSLLPKVYMKSQEYFRSGDIDTKSGGDSIEGLFTRNFEF